MKLYFSILIIFLLLSTSQLIAQNTPEFVYCEIIGMERVMSSKINIIVDYGQKMSWLGDNRMKDKSGAPLVFNTMIDALAYMGSQGWDFVQAYNVEVQNLYTVHFLLKKPFDKLEEEAKIEKRRIRQEQRIQLLKNFKGYLDTYGMDVVDDRPSDFAQLRSVMSKNVLKEIESYRNEPKKDYERAQAIKRVVASEIARIEKKWDLM